VPELSAGFKPLCFRGSGASLLSIAALPSATLPVPWHSKSGWRRNLVELHAELRSGQYRPGRSICFVNLRPKPREVWAAEFS